MGSSCAPDLPNKSIATAALPGPSWNCASFLEISTIMSPDDFSLPSLSRDLMPRNSSACPAPFVSSSAPAMPLVSLEHGRFETFDGMPADLGDRDQPGQLFYRLAGALRHVPSPAAPDTKASN